MFGCRLTVGSDFWWLEWTMRFNNDPIFDKVTLNILTKKYIHSFSICSMAGSVNINDISFAENGL